jgi:hypothetical protein
MDEAKIKYEKGILFSQNLSRCASQDGTRGDDGLIRKQQGDDGVEQRANVSLNSPRNSDATSRRLLSKSRSSNHKRCEVIVYVN